MKFKISYFYQIRFFTRNMIPVSTAVWDPKWFHDFSGDQEYTFKDKHSVYNGIRLECLHPLPENTECLNCESNKDPTKCSFIRKYKEQLESLNFDDIIEWCEELAHNIQKADGIMNEMEIVFIVYETPDNKCSERWPLIEWFRSHGIELEEFKS